MKDELNRLLRDERLTVVFQPIVNTDNCHLFGYEALTRGPIGSALHAPAKLFDTAMKADSLLELETICWRLAARRFADLGLPGKLFLNTASTSLVTGTRELVDAFLDSPLAPERVVIEITEQQAIEDYRLLRETLRTFHACGFEFAIDDLGAGYAGLRLWSELRPDYVKIDRHFLEGIHQDTLKREFLRSIAHIARETHCRVIAEGIETADEHAFLAEIGLSLAQGYFFGYPEACPPNCFAVPSTMPRLIKGAPVAQFPPLLLQPRNRYGEGSLQFLGE